MQMKTWLNLAMDSLQGHNAMHLAIQMLWRSNQVYWALIYLAECIFCQIFLYTLISMRQMELSA